MNGRLCWERLLEPWPFYKIPHLHLPSFILIGFGLAGGTFVGMMAAGLTEVLNVWPIMAKRIGVEEKIVILMMALALGKIVGSLFQWIYFVDH